MAKGKSKEYKLWDIHSLERSISAVFKKNDIAELDKYTYDFLVRHMGFIAYYDLFGFRATYEDVDLFRKALQGGEGVEDLNRNLEWAKRYESEPSRATPEYVKNVAEAIRALVHIARTAGYQPPLLSALDVELARKKITASRSK